MAEITLPAEVGRPLGSRPTRRLRAEGKIPGVVYGHGTEPVPVAVGARELRLALGTDAGANALLSLEAGDQTFLTLARELQRHPVKGTVTHVDFQIVRRDEVIAAEVQVVLTGEAVEVHHADGMVDQQLFTVPVRALPAAIPNSIEVDVSALSVGGAIRVADLALPEGVTCDLDAETAVVMGIATRAAEAEAGAEGEGGEAAAEGAGAEEAESTGGEG